MGAMLGHRGLLLAAGAIELVRANALHAAISFARSTTGTYFDAAKVMQVAAIDAPRFEYDGVTGAYLGLLIEPQRTNLYAQSSGADDSGWTKTRVSVVANGATAPDGTSGSDKLVEDTSSSTHLITRNVNHTAGQSYIRSAFCKAAERTQANLRIAASIVGSTKDGFFNLATGALGPIDAGVVGKIGGPFAGHYRCSLAFTATLTATSQCNVNLATGTSTNNYTGDGASGFYVWGQQMEDDDGRQRPTSYIPTTSVSITRSADSATFPTSLIDAAAGTFVIEHDCPSGDVLLGDGATALLVSQGPGKIAFAYDASGTMTVYNGGAGSTGSAVTLGATLRILGSSAAQAIGHCKVMTWHPGKQSEAWMQGQTT